MTTPDHTLTKGYKIGGLYEIAFPIGSGKGRRSYRTKADSGETVMVELIDLARLSPYSFDSDGKLLQIEQIRSLEHPAIPTLRDYGNTTIGKQKFGYIAFDFVGGETLGERFAREGPMSPFKAMPIVWELLDVIGYLHNQAVPIIHNAISLDSITISYADNRERPVLTLFGQTRNIHQDRKSISIEDLSIFHAAPELLNGIFIPQSDIFSVGAVLYHLIFGIPPWYDEKIVNAPLDNAMSILFETRKQKPDFNQVGDVLLDEHFITTIGKALSIDPNERFETADQFAKALKREVVFQGPTQQTSFEKRFERKDKAPGTGFDGLAGMAELKSILHNEVIRPIVERERFERFGIPLLNGVLLYGPPGCGKTFVAERLVEEIGFNFIMVNPSDLASPYVHGGQEKIGQLFKEAEQKAPCLIFIDEFDALVPSRESDVSHHYAAEVNEILAQMSGCGRRGIFVIGATNRPEKIDEAVLRSGRFDKLVYLPQPDFEQRESMFRQHMARCPIDLAVDYARLAQLTENYVSSDIANLVVEAARRAERGDCRVTMEMLELAIKENKPSVTLKQLKKYEKMNQAWQDERKGIAVDGRQSIGFIVPRED